MLKRIIILCAVVTALILGSAAPAFAWANGGPSPNDYGTHDWMLDKARVLAGSEGAWLNRNVALRATDDPDYPTAWSATYQLFYEYGIRRGAAQKTADLYYQAVEAYRSGDTTKASLYVGQLSHIYTDILQPFHSAYAARNLTTIHLEYERDFDDYFRAKRLRYNTTWIRQDSTPRYVKDIRKSVITAAAYSRNYYPRLYKYFHASHRIDTYTASYTKLMINRGANDLADIIRTIPTAAGVAPAPTTMTAWMQHRYVAQNVEAGAFFRCVDASGTPVEGAAVTISWPLPSGGVTKVTVYTDKYGNAHDYQNIGAAPLLRQMDVVGTQTSSGQTCSARTWYMTTPALADGSGAGISVLMSDRWPAQSTTVTAHATCIDTYGRRVAGMPVHFKWYVWDPIKQVSLGDVLNVDVFTDSRGIAVCPWNTGTDRAGQVIYARADTVAAGHTRAAVANLTVQR